jgi:asparagine N-glycosylation enzyme membrane subunit Stt3
MSKKIFISTCISDSDELQAFANQLKNKCFKVDYSPDPDLKKDDRWSNWYNWKDPNNSGLSKSIENCDIFMIYINSWWDSSSWMAEEARRGLQAYQARKIQSYYFYNPDNIEVKAAGMLPYLKEPLPKDFLNG